MRIMITDERSSITIVAGPGLVATYNLSECGSVPDALADAIVLWVTEIFPPDDGPNPEMFWTAALIRAIVVHHRWDKGERKQLAPIKEIAEAIMVELDEGPEDQSSPKDNAGNGHHE